MKRLIYIVQRTNSFNHSYSREERKEYLTTLTPGSEGRNIQPPLPQGGKEGIFNQPHGGSEGIVNYSYPRKGGRDIQLNHSYPRDEG